MERIVNDSNMYEYFHKMIQKDESWEEILGLPNSKMQGSSLSDRRIGELLNTFCVIYGEKDAREQVLLIDHVDRFLNGYIQIEGLSYLLHNNYNEIENNIFLEIGAKEGRQKKIREHFKHQFRNTYLASLLMKEFKLLDNMTDCILEEKNQVSDEILESYTGEEKDEKQKREYVQRVLFKSVYTASLFHDIGYPLAYFFRNVKQIHEYTPFLKIVSPNIKNTYTELKALLNASLLFRSVDDSDIRRKYGENDHGVLSAIGFLMHFYNSGRIYSMDRMDRCVIELAAKAIYHHTDRSDRRPMIFMRDPVSYMVRLCDDLQEWERFYLLIDDRHNYLKCLSCGKLIKNDGRTYQCTCKAGYEKITHIRNRKVNYIDFCKELHLVKKDTDDREAPEITIEITYDCYKQLELLLGDAKVIEKRDGDIKRLADMLKNQPKLPKIAIHHRTLSTNPIILIQKMIEEYGMDESQIPDMLQEQEMDKVRVNLEDFWKEYLTQKETLEFYGKEIEEQNFIYPERRIKFLENYLGEIHTLKAMMDVRTKKE